MKKFFIFINMLISTISISQLWGLTSENGAKNSLTHNSEYSFVPKVFFPSPQVVITPPALLNTPLLSSNVPTTVINDDPVLAKGRIILGKWMSLIEQNPNDPDKIALSDEEIKNDRISIESLLRVNNDVPEPTRQQYLLLLDLFKLAQIRNFNKSLKGVESRYRDSLQAQEKEGSFEIKRLSTMDSYGRSNDDKVVYGIKWYESRLEKLKELVFYFNKDVLPKLGLTPPTLLKGIKETIEEGQNTYEQYKRFVNCMNDPSTDQCRAFINVLSLRERKTDSLSSSEISNDIDGDEDR